MTWNSFHQLIRMLISCIVNQETFSTKVSISDKWVTGQWSRPASRVFVWHIFFVDVSSESPNRLVFFLLFGNDFTSFLNSREDSLSGQSSKVVSSLQKLSQVSTTFFKRSFHSYDVVVDSKAEVPVWDEHHNHCNTHDHPLHPYLTFYDYHDHS